MKEDNWKHRSKHMLCKTCMWYVAKTNSIGRCRKNAPSMSGWPVMRPTDFCGQHKIDETKLDES